MFKLKSPCANCPFRKGQGECFRLGAERIELIVESVSFQCHKTIDYSIEPGEPGHRGSKPQQCAGLMSLLARAGKPNAIMQIGERLGQFNPGELNHADVYASIEEATAAHEGN